MFTTIFERFARMLLFVYEMLTIFFGILPIEAVAANYSLITAAIQPRFRAIQPRYSRDTLAIPNVQQFPG